MKKLFLVAALALAALPSFAQEDEYAKFQGIWWGIIDDNEIVVFAFIDDTFVTTLDGGIAGKFFIEKENIIFQVERVLSLPPGWEKIEDTDNKGTWQYVFSGENLVLVEYGEAIVLRMDYRIRSIVIQ
jgi:hypothetical protein